MSVLDFIFLMAIPCGVFFLLICLLHLKDDSQKLKRPDVKESGVSGVKPADQGRVTINVPRS